MPTVEAFPRSEKCLLGDRLESTVLGVHECLIEATYTWAGAKSLDVAGDDSDQLNANRGKAPIKRRAGHTA